MQADMQATCAKAIAFSNSVHSEGLIELSGSCHACGLPITAELAAKADMRICDCRILVSDFHRFPMHTNAMESNEIMYVCTYVRMYVCTCVRVYVCRYVGMYVCTYVRMYVCTCLEAWGRL